MPSSPTKYPQSTALRNLELTCDILRQREQDDQTAGNHPVPPDPLLKNILMNIDRHRLQWDWSLARYAKSLRPRIRRVLWWCLTEIHDLDGLPPPVVTDTAVAFIKKKFSAADARFVNALLRKYLTENSGRTPAEICAGAPLHVRLNLPEIILERWRKFWDDDFIRDIADACQLPAPAVFRARLNQLPPEKIAPLLKPLELPEPFAGQRLYLLAEHAPADALQTIMETDAFYIQDPSTLAAPALLNALPGETVADLCCAPGGKSLLLAEAMKGRGSLICRDRSEHRLAQVRENLQGYPFASIEAGDAARPALPPESCDGVLLDVPCSNTGVIRRRPDVRWNFTEEKFRGLLSLQQEILDGGASLVKPGGRLVYSTCSIDPEENREQVECFLQRHADFSLQKEHRIFPQEFHDGGYAALLLRK